MTRALLIATMLMAGITPAIAKPIPCWLVKSAINISGSIEAAEQVAMAHGYSKEQIAQAKVRCLVKG